MGQKRFTQAQYGAILGQLLKVQIRIWKLHHNRLNQTDTAQKEDGSCEAQL